MGGGTPDTSNPEFWNGEIDWYSPTEIGEKIYANGSNKTITYLGLEKSSAKLLPAQKTILFTSRASIGDMAILIKAGATNQGFQSFIVNDEMDIYFLYSMGYKIKEFALKNASGSTFLEISKNELGKMDIFIPPTKAEQQAIGEFFRQLDDTIAFHQRELEKYQQLKQVLLDQLFV
ncbi:Predicted nucleotidyltransferases [Moraxella lacunata]|uniref:Predicted nucleotidyltransferases n=1 Tax=Moraxella lacunata TaxID=477 RepID=A0A378TAA1_MORLA|nr:Predicted nucleotidyltransferases [Moraxella lacunata]